jgi:transcriptional regulator with XRE-family HTH domain
MSLDATELGRRIRKIRENRGFTQQDLADLLAIPRPAMVQIEAGNRSLSSVELMKLSKELGFDPKDLFARFSTRIRIRSRSCSGLTLKWQRIINSIKPFLIGRYSAANLRNSRNW